MRHLTLTSFLVLTVSTASLAGGGTAVLRSADAIAGRYIVILADDAVQPAGGGPSQGPSVDEVAGSMALLYGARVDHRYRHALQGFAASMSEQQAQRLARDPRVAAVAEDARVELQAVQMAPPSWGIDRIDQRAIPLDGVYSFDNRASDVHVYVLDTGIRSTHQDFGGRVDTAEAFTAVADGLGTEDCNGHGTHVAGVIGSASFGGAKGVTLHPVRVVGCDGQGSISDVIAGVDWVTASFQAHQSGRPADRWKAVANVSLAAPGSWALDNAVWRSIDAGVPYVVAAGNHAGDACDFSPGRLYEAITVAASGSADEVAGFSDTGPCVDLLAPGVDITSTFNRDDADSLSITGTSVAAPHVAAVAALVLSRYPETDPELLARLLQDHATAAVQGELAPGTPNRLLYSSFFADPTDDPPSPAFTIDCRRRQHSCTFDAAPSWDDVGIAGYAWDFGDGSGADRRRIRHRFPTSQGSFTVTLAVTDTAGQTSSVSREVLFY